MKAKKLLSFIISTVMLVSTVGFTTVSADETTEYTLNELLEMSSDEFMKLDDAEKILNEIKQGILDNDSVYSGIISGHFNTTSSDERYKANISEKNLNELLGDSFEFIIASPINSSGVYDYIFTVSLADYYEDSIQATDEDILINAKTLYCLRQVCDFSYVPFGSLLPSAPSGEEIITGDVNLDKGVDLYDVIWIASDLIDIFKLTEGQQKVGDVNEDGVCDLYDAIAIAETLM